MVTRSNFGNPRLVPVAIDFSASGDNIIVTGISGAAIELYQIYLVVAGATNLKFKDGVGGAALGGALAMTANGSITLDFSGAPWHETSVGNSLVLNSSNAVQVSGTAYSMVR